jgi:epsilon-lactone hydrolase
VSWVLGVGALIAVLWAFTRFYLRGEDLSRFDGGPSAPIGDELEPSVEHYEVLQLLSRLTDAGSGAARRNRLTSMRVAMDNMGSEADLRDIELKSVDVDGVPGEWLRAPGSDPDRRLLYLHGGAFTMGSPKSHRVITSKLARISGMAVLAVDYRLMPEHKRLDCLTDCQTAYRWILDNGPEGPAPLTELVVAGDSAGGNLTLAIIAWARDEKLRPANAAIALSPATDSAFTSPTMVSNVATDHMLGPMLGKLTRLPRSLLLWVSFLNARTRPCDPRVSPVYGDLSNLPPTLIHASEAEMLLDDARRYTRKATEAGSEATLETWRHMLHVWHAFEYQLPEAKEAFEHIARFLELNRPAQLEQSASG